MAVATTRWRLTSRSFGSSSLVRGESTNLGYPDTRNPNLGDDRLDHCHRAVRPAGHDLDRPRTLVQENVERLPVGLELVHGLCDGHGAQPEADPLRLGRTGPLAVDLVEGQVQSRESVGRPLVRGKYGCAAAVYMDVDPADDRGEATALALLGKIHVGLGHLATMSRQAGP